MRLLLMDYYQFMILNGDGHDRIGALEHLKNFSGAVEEGLVPVVDIIDNALEDLGGVFGNEPGI
jgi:hypothetical protein